MLKRLKNQLKRFIVKQSYLFVVGTDQNENFVVCCIVPFKGFYTFPWRFATEDEAKQKIETLKNDGVAVFDSVWRTN